MIEMLQIAYTYNIHNIDKPMGVYDMSNKKDIETKLPDGPLPAGAPAPTPEVKVEGPENLDDKKQELQQEQKKQSPQPQDTGRNLMNTSTWIEFFAELMKYFRENSAKKPQQETPKPTQETLPKQTWNKASEPSPGAKEMRDSGNAPKIGGHRQVSNEKFLNENLKDSGLTEPQVKGLAGMLDNQGVNLNAVQKQKGSQDNKAVPAGSKSNSDFIQDVSQKMGLNLSDKAVNSFANLTDKLGINLSSMMNKAMEKSVQAGAKSSGTVNPQIAALKSAQSAQSSAGDQPKAVAGASSSAKGSDPSIESLGGVMKGR